MTGGKDDAAKADEAVTLSEFADRYGEVPVPVEGFGVDAQSAKALGEDFMRQHRVVPFGRIGALTLVAYAPGGAAALKDEVKAKLGEVRFFLSEPGAIDQVLRELKDRVRH